MAIFTIHHITKYEYDRPVIENTNEIKIFPFQCKEQEIIQQELNITYHPDVFEYSDYWGNKTGLFNVLHPHKELMIESKLTIRTTLPEIPNLNYETGWNDLRKEVNKNLQLLELSTPDTIQLQDGIDEIIENLQADNKSIATVIQDCNTYIFTQFKYIKGITTIETTVDEILEHRSGVCQDFAHVMLQILRTLGIPSRYVSGYICPNKNGMRGEGATHAWVEAYIPGYGWAGTDPTNNVWVTNNHIILAVGNHFKDCTPVKGMFKGLAKQRLSVYVSVGYEDGQVFEEKNNVQLQSIDGIDNEPFIIDFSEQHQQQQQQ